MKKIILLGTLLGIPTTDTIIVNSPKILTPLEEKCVREIVYSEAGNQPFEGKLAVAYIIHNRKFDNRFPFSACSIIHQPKQFTKKRYNKKHKKNYLEADLVAKSYFLVEDPTKRGLYFHNWKIGRDWKRNKKGVVKIKDHLFYK